MADSFFLLALPHHEARAPAGLEHPAATAYDDLDSKARARAGRAVESLLAHWQSAPAGGTEALRAVRLGDSGYVLSPSPYCRAAARGSVVALLSGEISATPGHDLLAEAHSAWMAPSAPGVEAGDDEGAEALLALADVLARAASDDEALARAFSDTRGDWALAVFDSAARRLWAAQSAACSRPLYWGCTEAGLLVVGTRAAALDVACDPTSTAFPGGCVFASSAPVAVSPGRRGFVMAAGFGDTARLESRLLSFVESFAAAAEAEGAAEGAAGAPARRRWKGVKAVPRLDAAGVLCGRVYRVATEPSLVALNAAH